MERGLRDYGPGDQVPLIRPSPAASPAAADSVPAEYAALSPAARLVALVYAVGAPCPLGVARVQRAMSKAGVLLDGRRLDMATVRRFRGELSEAGLVEEWYGQGLRASPAWSFVLARIAHENGHLTPLFIELCATQRPWDPAQAQMRLRCHLIRGDIDALRALEETAHGISWDFLVEPLAEDLLRVLPAPLRSRALTACLDHVIETCAPPAPVTGLCGELSEAPETHAADIAFIRVLRGRFDAALAGFEDLPASSRESKVAATGLAATRALIALLRGDDESARQHIEDCLAEERKGTRKRLVFPDSRAFAWSLLALVRLDSLAANQLLERIVRGAELNPNRRARELDWVLDAAGVRTGARTHGRLLTHPALSSLMDGLLNCWLDSYPYADSSRGCLLEYRRRAAANGFAWVVGECDEVLARHGRSVDRSVGGGADAGRAERGAGTLVDLVRPLAEWENALKSLEFLAEEAGRKAAGRSGARRAVRRRLAWEILGEGDSIVLSAREQRQKKNGSWTRGRKIAAKRLAAEFPGEEFLLSQDREAIAAIATDSYWTGRVEHYLGIASLSALAGHPHVFNAAGESVDIALREPELSVDEDAEGRAVVRVEPRDGISGDDFDVRAGARNDSDDDYIARMATERRCEVTRLTADHRRLFNVVPESGLVVPAESRARLLAAVSTLSSSVRVQSDIVDGAANATKVAADSQPWVRLEPAGAGLTAALVVEPVPDSDICFTPGGGGANVFAHRNGVPVQARRDLQAERLAVDRLIEQCPMLSSRPTELEPLVAPEPEQCLELLDRLASAGARCKWPRGEPFRIVARASSASLSLRLKSAEEWLQASGKLVVDEGRAVQLKRLFELLDESPGSRFLRLDEGEFLALSAALRRQFDDFASLAAPAARGAVRLHPLATLALDELFDGAEVDADKGWLDLRARLAGAESFEPELPGTLRAELRPYQRDGFRWLARLAYWGAGACLADDMGLGKTVQSLAVLLERAPGGPALVVAPTSVVANWVDEARRFAPTLNVRVYAGPAASRTALLDRAGPFDLFVTTYGVLQNDVEMLAETPWHSVALDEAQAIKNPVAKRTKAARRLKAGFRLVTTGTPIQNNLMDLHSLFGFVNPGLLGSLQAFRRGFALPIERDGDAMAQARLRRLIAPFVLRRLKADVLDDLPERTEITLRVTMSPEEATLYETLRGRAVAELEAVRGDDPDLAEGARRVQVLAHLTRLRLACCHPRLVLDASDAASSKLAIFAETLEELLENRHKVLVFSQFVKHLKLIEQHLKDAGVSYQYLDGSTPAKARASRIAAFQAGQGDVFLISLKAGGLGLNLTAADYVIHMDPWWNPAVEDQASDRAHRIGQTRPVTIYRLVTEGTIEEQIVDLHRRKRDLADQLLEGASTAGRLSADELLDLIRKPAGDGRRPP